MSHEVDIQSKLNDSDVANYEDYTSAQSTSLLSESLQECNHDELGHDRQGDMKGNRTSDAESAIGQGSASDHTMTDSEKLEDSAPEEMPDTEQPRQTQSPTFEDATILKEDGSINGAELPATQTTTESEPWSKESSKALTHAKGDMHACMHS